MMIAKQLGLIPAWQYAQDWAQNPNYNNNVTFPPGWNQLTIQPVGANYAPPPEAGLGRFSIADDCCARTGNSDCCRSAMRMRMRPRGMLRGLGDVQPRWLMVGGIGLLAVALLGGAALMRS